MFKKALVIIFTCLIISSTVIFANAFSIDLGGSILTPVSAYYFDLYSGGTGNIVNGDMAQASDLGGNYNAFLIAYDVRPSASIYPTYIECNFSGSNYGRLDLIYVCDIGGVYPDSFNGLYDLSGSEPVKISDFTIITRQGITCYSLSYFGFIPSKIGIQAIFPTSNNSPLNVLNTVAEITFTPDLSYINQGVIDNQNQNTDEIVSNQNQNTQDIINNQNQLQQNEKDEAEISGNDGVDSIVGGIENKGEGFFNAMGNLISVMSYNGTECKWNLPPITLPKIDGVMDSITLTDNLEIDFEYWISQIPTSIMRVVQAILTIALILFCVKELYSVLSYVFTLRGG